MDVQRTIPPLPASNPLERAEEFLDSPVSVLIGSDRAFAPEQLARSIVDLGRARNRLWLRIPTAEGVWEATLARAVEHRWGPEPVDPPDAFSHLPAGAMVVLELGGRPPRALERLLRAARPILAERRATVVVLAPHRRLTLFGPRPVAPVAAVHDLLQASPLAVAARSALARMAGEHPVAVQDVLDALEILGSEPFDTALPGPGSAIEIMDRLTLALVRRLGPAPRAALRTSLDDGHWYPRAHGRCDPVLATDLKPWMVPLERQWGLLRTTWRPSVARALRAVRGAAPTVGAGRPTVRPSRAASAPVLAQAQLFGTFAFRIDGMAVTGWRGQRGASVLRYLLAQPAHRCSRDEILEQFWPGVQPAAARNRLQVAVSGVRKTLLARTPTQIVEYADGGYRLHPDLPLDVDVERFDAALVAARAADHRGNQDRSIAAYREAIRIHRADFASDAPFEGWTLMPRERLRLAYLDALDRLARILLHRERLDECVGLGQRMLEADPCREDAHRLLMHCYAGQGRIYQALRQYEFCARVLTATIEATPAAATTRLYDAIRTGSRQAADLLG